MKGLDLNKRWSDETKLFVREPVDEICNKIKKSSSSKIVLGGGRGTGKSIILEQLENKNLGTNSQFIRVKFDSVGYNDIFKDEEQNLKISQIRYELLLCQELLFYIRSYYSIIYKKNFDILNNYIANVSDKFWNYLNNHNYGVIFDDKVIPKELSADIINKFKTLLSVENFSLAIDRFDWINNKKARDQIILSQYFDLFDKTVITCDDKEIIDEPSKIADKEFMYMESNYGKNLEVVKEIIRKKFESDSNYKNDFSKLDFREDLVENLIQKFNGNISVILTVIKNIVDDYKFYDESFSLKDVYERSINEQMENVKKLKRMGNYSKLHL